MQRHLVVAFTFLITPYFEALLASTDYSWEPQPVVGASVFYCVHCTVVYSSSGGSRSPAQQYRFAELSKSQQRPEQ